MFFTWAARTRENRIRFVGDAVLVSSAQGDQVFTLQAPSIRTDYGRDD